MGYILPTGNFEGFAEYARVKSDLIRAPRSYSVFGTSSIDHYILSNLEGSGGNTDPSSYSKLEKRIKGIDASMKMYSPLSEKSKLLSNRDYL